MAGIRSVEERARSLALIPCQSAAGRWFTTKTGVVHLRSPSDAGLGGPRGFHGDNPRTDGCQVREQSRFLTVATIRQEQQADNSEIGPTADENSAETSSIPHQARLRRSATDDYLQAPRR